MKKTLALLLILIMSLAVLTGCTTNTVFDDLEKYLNVEMKEINENYGKITNEVSTWETIEDDATLAKSIIGTLLPLVDDSLEKLENVKPKTEEVKALKEKYIKVMDSYKVGFEALYEGCSTQDEETIERGNENLERGIELLDEYNTALEELAKEVGAEIEY